MLQIFAIRKAVRRDLDRWRAENPHPLDPLTQPVSLMMRLFDAMTAPRALIEMMLLAMATVIVPMFIADVAARAVFYHWGTHVTMSRADEARTMQQWIDNGRPIQLMRCEGAGLQYAEGYCRTIGDGAWRVPPQVAEAIERRRAQAQIRSDPFAR